MPRTRQQNVTAAQWSANGAALGSSDLTLPDNQVFGANVFSPAVQRRRLPKHVYKALQRTLARGEALDTLALLGLRDAADAMILNIVTVIRNTPVEATANLIGPIVVNRRTRIGRQLVISNYSRYSAHHALVENAQASYARSA